MPHARSARVPSRLACRRRAGGRGAGGRLRVVGPGVRAGQPRWVSPTGSDTNPGTEAAPFATLQKALDVATPGMTINLARGSTARPSSPRWTAPPRRRSRSRARDGQGPGRTERGALRDRWAGVQHRPQLLHPRRLHDRRPGGHHPQRRTRTSPRCRRSGRRRTRWQGARGQQQAGLRRGGHQGRHHRHDDLEHVPHRIGRRVRALPQPGREQPGRQLGDPVVRDARPGRRAGPVQVPQRRGRLHRHEPEVDHAAVLPRTTPATTSW